MDRVEVTMAFSWVPVGAVSLDEQQKLRFPKTAAQPGLYRFEIISAESLTQYIGETDQLSRRLQHYRTPGPSQRTNLRLNALLVEHLNRGDRVSLSAVTEGVTASCAGREHHVDLSVKSERVLLECAALLNARAAGVPTLNL
ncbi:GIY-YIG nuclease family protein [Alteraurantiacibacter palmitatis]|uniref:GIY-YIG nuclease family protein n=1 Tax=Alteraurantiacibacter palmitatis TaxID=2054628 RepID=A0ABV7E557_9SPHN